MDSQIKIKGCPFNLFHVMWTTQRILATRNSALAILQIVRILFFLFYRAWVNYFTCVFENRLAMMQIKCDKNLWS